MFLHLPLVHASAFDIRGEVGNFKSKAKKQAAHHNSKRRSYEWRFDFEYSQEPST